jgi:hypothetical protein
MYLFSFFIGLYWFAIFIFLIVLYVKAIKRKELSLFKLINKISIISIVGIPLYAFVYSLLDKSSDLGVILVWMIEIVCGILFVISFLTSFITKKVIKNKLNNNGTKLNKSITIILILYFVFASIGIAPFINDLIRREKYSKYIISYLTKKYGDGDFKLVSMYDERGQLWNSSNTYDCTITSSYMNYSFEVEIDISTKEIVGSTFLNSYGMKKEFCDEDKGFYGCLNDYIDNDYLNKLTYKDVYNAVLSTRISEEKITEDFGRVPNISEVAKYADVSFNHFMIEKELTSDDEKEFTNYVIAMYKDYKKYFEELDEHEDKNIIKFKLRYSNPFTKASGYQHDGYIKIEDNNLYIYNKPTPIIIPMSEINK